MPKNFESRAAVEAKNLRLMHRVAALEAELAQVKGKPTPKVTKLPPIKPKPVFKREKVNPRNTPPPPFSPYDSKLVYDDGRLVDSEVRNRNFMQHTESSAEKTIRPDLALGDGVTWTTKHKDNGGWGSDLITSDEDAHRNRNKRTTQKPPLEPLPGSCTNCETIDAGKNDTSDQSLAARSQLDHDSDLIDPLFWDIRLPFEEQYKFLEHAYELVQQGTWEAIATHWPRDRDYYFPEHWKQVRFGYRELQDSGFGTERYPERMTEMCGHTRHTIYFAMYDVIKLRNAVCHPKRGHSIGSLDFLMQKAQRLLVLLQDEERSFALRDLRNQAQDRCREIHAEVEMRDLWDELPKAVLAPWPLHLEILLRRLDVEEYSEEDGVIGRASRRWRSRVLQPVEDLVHSNETHSDEIHSDEGSDEEE